MFKQNRPMIRRYSFLHLSVLRVVIQIRGGETGYAENVILMFQLPHRHGHYRYSPTTCVCVFMLFHNIGPGATQVEAYQGLLWC